MAETESHDYWCYHCDKSVAVETLPDDVVCFDCKNGFVESISVPAVDHRLLNMLRLIARPENAPPPSSPSYEDFLGLTWISDDDEESDRSVTAGHEEDDDNGEEHSENNGSDVDNGEEYNGSDDDNGEEYSDDDNGEEHSETESEFEEEEEEEEEENEVIEDEDDQMRVRSISEVLRQRLREIDDEEDRLRARSISEVLRHRLRGDVRQSHLGALDWPEVVMDLEQLSDRIRLHVLESEYYVGNPGDYVDAAGYEALLQNLAETDNGGRRGAPPASKAAVEGLETVVISKTTTCAVCRDLVNVGEVVKKLPCGHEYHGDCILPWLDSRNSCPVCRFELPTDDPEYEEERRSRRVDAAASSAIPSGDSGLE